jgi:hypothetical protein
MCKSARIFTARLTGRGRKVGDFLRSTIDRDAMEGCGDQATDKVSVRRRVVYPVPEANKLTQRLEDATEKNDKDREKSRQRGRCFGIGRQGGHGLPERRDPHLEEHEQDPHADSARALVRCLGPSVIEVHGVEPWDEEEGTGDEVVGYFDEEGGEDESGPVIHF